MARIVFVLPLFARGDVYDFFMPRYESGCKSGRCVAWSSVHGAGDLFANGTVPEEAGANCAMPAGTAGAHEQDGGGDRPSVAYMNDSLAGPWCFCSDKQACMWGDTHRNQSVRGCSLGCKAFKWFEAAQYACAAESSCGGVTQTDKGYELRSGKRFSDSSRDEISWLISNPDCNQHGLEWQAYCKPPRSTVEQLNLQLAASDVVVASFITYEDLPSRPAIAMLGTSEDRLEQVEGMSHKYSPPNRTYIMHYVPFRNLKPRQRYYYKVKSGSDASDWTPVYSFRAPYSAGVTRIATYGDMGHSLHNNMGNLKVDCESGLIDAIVHMGDHCYDMGMSLDARGDAYMNVFQPVLQSCPWLPVIGNHEVADGDKYKHYEQIAMGEMIGQEGTGLVSSADTALGYHLSTGMLYGAGMHGTVPSNTSRYTSTNIGQIHITAIDNMNLDDAQLAWIEQDLQVANSNREQQPWIMVVAHVQMYHPSMLKHLDSSASFFFSEEAEGLSGEERFASCSASDGGSSCETLADRLRLQSSKLEPLLLKYGVDIFNAGHVHDYFASWPMKNGTLCQKSYDNPKCPVYIVEGNGGVPGSRSGPRGTLFDCSDKAPWCRIHSNGFAAYGRITVTDAQTLRYDHIMNGNSSITDTFTITQKNHGPFSEIETLV